MARFRSLLPVLLAGCGPVPAWAAAPAPPPLEAYGALPSVENMTLSPDGTKLAAQVHKDGQNLITVFDPVGGQVFYQAVTGAAKLRRLDWAGNDKVLVSSSATANLGLGFNVGQAELWHTTIVDTAGKAPAAVFARDTDIAQATWGYYGTRMIDGVPQAFIGGIAFEHDSINSRLGGTMKNTQITLFRVDVTKNRTARAAPPAPEKFSRHWLVGPDGGVAASLDQDKQTGSWSIHNGAGTRLASGTAPFGDVSLHFLGRNADSVVYGVENDEGSYDYFEVPLAGGTAIPFLPDQPFDAAFVDDRTGAVIGTLPTAADAHARFFDPARQAVANKIVRAFGKFQIELSDWNHDFSKVVVHTSGNGDSGTWYFVDVASLRAQPVGYERVNILPEQVGPISTVAYKASDGMEMDGILTLPPGREAKNLPVIMLPHGGPAAHDTPAFDWWAQAFASRGYAVFQPNFRGSTNRDATFQRAGDGQWGRKMQTDISDGLAELVRRGLVDPRRACIMGGSYGGYAALAGVTLQHGLYRCAVSVAGVSDLTRRFNQRFEESDYNPLVGRILERQMGERSQMESVSPRRFAATADAPILLIHGKDDTVVPFTQSTDMADALKAAGKPYEMTVLRHEDHWLSSADTRTQMLQAAMAFVQKYNPTD